MFEEFNLVAFGLGKSFFPYLDRLDKCVCINAFCDNNDALVNKKLFGDDRMVISVKQLLEMSNPYVVITADSYDAILEIEQFLGNNRIPFTHARNILNMERHPYLTEYNWPQLIQRNKIHRFIDLNVQGTTVCNMHCEYCYVWRRAELEKSHILSSHSIEELDKAFSVENTGGVCFINMCARGETMLADNIVDFTKCLLEKGHYVSIVTNGTITKKFDEMLLINDSLLDKLFFKISFHYKELKRLGLVDTFWRNVNKIKNSPCSFTIEITPGDGSIPFIDDMKEMCLNEASGAFPHVSFTRDSTKNSFDLLSNYSINEYRTIWSQFDSKMFKLKSKWYGIDMKKYYCHAGNWSCLVNMINGDVKTCYRHEPILNIFDDRKMRFPVSDIKHECGMDYCFNNHAFLAWGCIPEIDCDTYLDMRDRTDRNGDSWVKEPMRSFMSQKLWDNNYIDMEKWPDYGKIYKNNRSQMIVIFNSPDYSNLGDHAIAYGERKFFADYFPEYEVVEISCTEYEKENLKIRTGIRNDDIIVITGGGNIGNLWLRINDIANSIIKYYPNNTIIVCPQTYYFEDNNMGLAEKKSFVNNCKQHHHLMLTAREEKSFNLLKSILGDENKIVAAPDMALYLINAVNFNKSNRNKTAAICFRNDKEKIEISDDNCKNALMNEGYSVITIDTILGETVSLSNRENLILQYLEKIKNIDLVVTDRLHCMILCCIIETPCILFDSLTNKNMAVREFAGLASNVELCNNVKEISLCIEKIQNNCDPKFNKSNINNMFDKYALDIRRMIGI